jgi:tetratricopeptide (TPR) repeat protein
VGARVVGPEELAQVESYYRRAIECQGGAPGAPPARAPEDRAALARTHEALAETMLASGRPDEAEQSMRAAVDVWDGLAEADHGPAAYRDDLLAALEGLGRLLFASGRRTEGLHEWGRAVQGRAALAAAHPDDPAPRERWAESLNDLAWRLAVGGGASPGDLADAVRLAEQVATAFPSRPLYLNTLGVACYYYGDHHRAAAALARSVEFGGGSGFDYYPLAMAYGRLGDVVNAREAFRRAEQWRDQAGNPDHPELLRFREEAAGLIERGSLTALPG